MQGSCCEGQLLIPQHCTTSCLHQHSTTLGMPHPVTMVCVCVCISLVGSQIAEQLGMAASPSTSESIVPWELPIVVSNEFLVDCLGVSLSGPSNVQCV